MRTNLRREPMNNNRNGYRNTGKTAFSTIYQDKGLESDYVFISHSESKSKKIIELENKRNKNTTLHSRCSYEINVLLFMLFVGGA